MKWIIHNTGSSTAEENMALDYALLQGLESTSSPILHLYDWSEKSATYGHFTDPLKLLRKSGLEKYHIQCAKRPTGGGLLFHITDFTYSILIPAGHEYYSTNTLDNYRVVNQIIVKLIHSILSGEKAELLPVDLPPPTPGSAQFCLAKPTIYDVMWRGQKIGGAAQRKTKKGFLHQGTISIAPLSVSFLEDLILDRSVISEMYKQSCYLLPEGSSERQIANMRETLSHALVKLLCSQ